MSTRTAILTGDRHLEVFKLGREWQRDLEVLIRTDRRQPVARLAFPADQDRIEVAAHDLPEAFEVVVRRRRILHRLRHRAQKHHRVLGKPTLRVVITGSGRCGTSTLARFLDGQTFTDGTPIVSLHEPLSEYVVPALVAGDIDLARRVQAGLGHHVESSPYYALYPDALADVTVVHLIRDGRAVVQSGMNRGWYQNDSIWNRLKPRFEGDAFTQSCHLWRLACEQAAAVADVTVRLEDLVGEPEAPAALCEKLGIVWDGRPMPHANRGRVPASWEGWTEKQRQVFAEVAGGVMDRFYGGWG